MSLLKKLRKIAAMAKNSRKCGRSMRNGNAPSPYTKYNKTPHRYSAAYYSWYKAKLSNKPVAPIRVKKNLFLEAAE